MKKYIFIDIDGTLFSHDKYCIPNSAIEAIRQARANGHELFVCTGRAKPMVEKCYYDLPMTGFVYAAGAHVEIEGKLVRKEPFPNNEMDKIIEKFNELNIAYTLEGATRSFGSRAYSEFFEQYPVMDHDWMEMIRNSHVEDAQPEDKKQVLKITFMVDNDHLKEMKDFLEELPEQLDTLVYPGSSKNIMFGEISLHESTKATGIKTVLQYFGADVGSTVAFGDSENDIPMIRYANTGVAMGNGSDKLKKAADYITKDIDEDGLYHAFKELELI